MSDVEKFADVACSMCGCVCDDLTVSVRDNRVIAAERACSLAEPWFEALGESLALEGHQVDQQPVGLDDALDAAAKLLGDSKAPLVYGLSRSSTDGQRAAVRLADQLGAVIDTTASRCHAPSIMAVQEVGESTCSLGEVANRCDLVIYWGSNPAESHPRHTERYGVEPRGMFVPNGRSDRYVVVVDVEETATSREADMFLKVEPGRDFEVIWALRALVKGVELSDRTQLGASFEELESLAERMRTCRSGVVFFGLGLTHGTTPHSNVEALLRLTSELNDHTRFYARRMRVPGDVTGADSVLCWQTGYPFSVSLSRRYPRYNPGEYSANEMLERGETDCCVIVGSEALARFSPAALEGLAKIPTIALDYPTEQNRYSAKVAFTSSIYGVHARGTAYRMDETPIPLRPFLQSDLPTDGDILRAIGERLGVEMTKSE